MKADVLLEKYYLGYQMKEEIKRKCTFPKTMWLTLTRYCNLKCKWCYSKYKENEYMELEFAKQAIDKFYSNGGKRIVLIGGEPTVYPYFGEIIDYISAYRIDIGVASNGIGFSKQKYLNDLIDNKKMIHINLSLKAVSNHGYQIETGNGMFYDVLKAIDNFNEEQIDYIVSYVLLKQSASTLVALKELLLAHHVKKMVFQTDKPTIFSDDYTAVSDLVETCKLVYQIFYETRSKLAFKYELSFPLCAIERKFVDLLLKDNLLDVCCDLYRCSGIVIDTNGDLLPCNHFSNYPLMDHVTSADVAIDYCKSEMFQRFGYLAGMAPKKECVYCELWEKCRGGCILRWLKGEKWDI